MGHIEAVYCHGVFEPLQPVNLRDEQRVHLNIEPAEDQSPQSWLGQVCALQAAVIQRQGVLPNSSPDIAADRLKGPQAGSAKGKVTIAPDFDAPIF